MQQPRLFALAVMVAAALVPPALVPSVVGAQQVADSSFQPALSSPGFAPAAGPIVLIDEAHGNFHTAGERYMPFARLLERDGFRVRASRARFTRELLDSAHVLVVANALHEQNAERWALPTPSAFDSDEITAVREWVRSGGALLLIADHMPFPGAAAALAGEFGVAFINGFAIDTTYGGGTFVFRRTDGSLAEHAITTGRFPSERVDSVMAFTGQAFTLAGEGEPLLMLPGTAVVLEPEEAWQFTPETPRRSAEGMLQGAVLRFGRGRVAVFGEAAMFTAQLSGPERRPVGMNEPRAPDNAAFALNLMRWLSDSPAPAAMRTVVDNALVSRLVRDRVLSGRNKGIVAGVVDASGTRFFAAGITRDSLGDLVNANTVFEIGSVTKVLTALLLAEMVERRDVGLDDLVSSLLPDTARMPAEGDAITLLHLATHTSGLPRLPWNLRPRDARNPYVTYDTEQLYDFLIHYLPQGPPGERYEYSNLGFGLLGHALSVRARMTYQGLLMERVLMPLGMRETAVELGPSQRVRLASGHDAGGAPTSGWDFAALAGAGALRSTPGDMARLVEAALAASRGDDDSLLARALRATMRPHMQVDGSSVMGLGWHILTRGGRRLILQNGRTGGHASFVGLDPERGIGVVLLTNSSAPVDDIGFGLLTSGR